MTTTTLALAACAAGALFCAPPALARQDSLEPELSPQVRRRISTIVTSGEAGVLLALDLLLARQSDAPDLGREQRERLYGYLRTLPDSTLGAALSLRVDPETDLHGRLAVAQILGEVGRATSTKLLFVWFGEVEPPNLRRPYVAGRIESALVSVCRRDRGAYNVVARELEGLSAPLLDVVARAMGTLGRADGIALLTELLGIRPELDLLALEALGELDLRDRADHAGRASNLVQAHWSSPDPRVRARVAISLGRLGDVASVEVLLHLLEDEDPTVASSAHGALRRMSGQGLPADVDRWRSWLAAEERWLQESFPRLVETPFERSDAWMNAVRELARHRLYKSEVSAALVARLRTDGSAGVPLLTRVLIKLDDPRVVSEVAALTSHARTDVRAAAFLILRELTGEDLPDDPKPWASWLSG